MMERIKKFAIELHEDESGPNTVEWVLLIRIALIILAVLIELVAWAINKMNEKAQNINEDDIGEFDPG